jgi:hypothetical protein
VFAIVLLGIAIAAVFTANMLAFVMIGEVNRKREVGTLKAYFGFTPLKAVRVW